MIVLIVIRIKTVKTTYVTRNTIYKTHHIVCDNNKEKIIIETDEHYKITSAKIITSGKETKYDYSNLKEPYFELFKETLNSDYQCKEE